MKKYLLMAVTCSLVMMIAGCGGKKEAAPETKAPETETAVETVIETEVIETEEPDYTGLVTDVFAETFTTRYNDCSYVIPQINIDSEAVKSLNQEIYDEFHAYYETALVDADKYGYPMECAGVRYEWYVNKGLLSLVISYDLYPDASGWTEYNVYNVMVKEGSICNNKELVGLAGLSEKEYRVLVKDAQGNKFACLYYGIDDRMKKDSFTRDQFSRTIAAQNVAFAKPYLGESGDLMIRARIYSLAAGDSYPYLINLNNYEKNSWYESMKQEVKDSADDSYDEEDNTQASSSNADGDYVLPDSGTKYLSESDLAGLSKHDLMLARNEIYARHGRKFKDEELRTYFEGKDWYSGTINPDDFSTSMLNDYELKNIDFIKSHE